VTRRSRMLIGGVAGLALLASNALADGPPWRAHQTAPKVAASCLNLPVSGLLMHPTSCRITGPASIVVVGTDTRSGQHREIALSGARAGRVRSAAGGAPAPSSSLYVYGSYTDVCGLGATTGCPLYNDRANEEVPATGGMTVLDFGAPCFEPTTLALGTQLFNSQGCTPDSELVILAEAWLRGYRTNPNGSVAPSSILVAGSSNSLTAAVPGNALTPAQMSAHGQAWFRSVVNPIASAASALDTPVAIWGGSDIEESSDGSWYDGPTTAAWVDAYVAASGASKPCTPSRSGLMVDYGDYVPNEPGWSPGAVYHVAWQAAAACPLPEIYMSENANEWQSLNQYALSVGLQPMQFVGVLSKDGASGSLSGPESWNALRSATGQQAPYLSIIGEARPMSAEVPDPPTAVTAVPGPGLATVGWSAPAWDGGSGVMAYTVTVYTGSIFVQDVTVGGSPVPEATIIAGLANGTSYTFYVSATNQVGTGPLSLPSSSVAPSSLFPMR
jgi:fibronectin type III domain protein